jgi:MFS family permease
MVSFVMLAVAHSAHWEIYVASALMGIGIGLAFASLANLIVEAVPPEQTGVATGMNTVMRSLGGSVGGQIGASVLAGGIVAGVPTEGSFTAAFALAAGACAFAALAAIAVPRPGAARERSATGEFQAA